MQTVLEKKVFLINTLSADSSFILQYAQQDKIITKREYNNLNHRNHTSEQIVTNLLDTVMNKGDQMCHKFVTLLKQGEIHENYPELLQYFPPVPKSHNQDIPDHEGQVLPINPYRMSSNPRGHCLIINNVDFVTPSKTRYGSNIDEESLKEVFQWLGFSLDVYKNQTAEQMKNLLKNFSQKHHAGDCFVCCIMSHGSAEGVYGTNEIIVTKDDIFGPFTGKSCPSLNGKPKVFLIQACRGNKRHPPVHVQADSYEEEAEAEDDMSVDMNSLQMISIPEDADFLIVRSTIKGYVSYREQANGTWFIQSLCKQLKKYCPMGEDLQSILLCVNKEVSEKALAKQMPVHKVTLRKKLVFHVPHQQ
ncbi:caspase 20, apoptosis-related cysteine peptidase [Silurus meridionalis]|nr:caspase 20, apoptosis-related cysteine peptidase [Silurus meridionalis]